MLKDAESYNGPSLVRCYCPCIEQGIRGGLGNAIKQEKRAVECGYFLTYTYDPRLREQGKSPLVMAGKAPDFDKLQDFLLTSTRYSQLPRVNPDHAQELFDKNRRAAEQRYHDILRYGGLEK